MDTLPEKITILLADDHPTTRAGIRAILDATPDLQVIGEASNGPEIQRLVAELHPNILLLDLLMPDMSPGLMEKWVRTHYPDTITLILTAHDRDYYLATMMDAGAVGLIDKNEPSERLISAIRRAAQGEILFDSSQLGRIQRWQEEAGRKWDSLTKREREVLQLLNQGLENDEIAEKLFISPRTVIFHVSNIMHKLGAKTRLEVVTWLHKYLPENL